MVMNSKTGIAFSIIAIAAVIALFASGPLAATKAQAFGLHGGFGFHRGFGFGFHRGFGFGFHRGFGFGFPGWGWGGGCGGCGGCW
jgi:hypothetical protein